MARILLVEDEKDLISLLRHVLAKADHQIFEAANGQEALRLLGLDGKPAAAPKPDLIVCDVMMPQMDGFSFCSRLLQNERTKGIPVIVLSAQPRTLDVFIPCSNVAARYAKPVILDDLRRKVEEILGKPKPPRPGGAII